MTHKALSPSDPPTYFAMLSPAIYFRIIRWWLLIATITPLLVVGTVLFQASPHQLHQEKVRNLEEPALSRERFRASQDESSKQVNAGLFALTVLGSNALLSWLVFTKTQSPQDELDGRVRDIRKAHHTGLVEKVKRAMVFPSSNKRTQEKENLETEIKLFDLSLLQNIDKFPNIIMVASPGSGKSTLAEYIISQYNGLAYTLVMNPHQSPGDFQKADLVIGGGDNIGTTEDEGLNSLDLLTPSTTIATGLLTIQNIKTQRYQERAEGKTSFKPICVVIDEMPSVATELGKKWFASFFPRLLMECRKVKIQFIIIGQSYDVASMGLEGKSSLRDATTTIWLGQASRNQARKLLKEGNINEATHNHLLTYEYPALIDDEVLDTTQTATAKELTQGVSVAGFTQDGGESVDALLLSKVDEYKKGVGSLLEKYSAKLNTTPSLLVCRLKKVHTGNNHKTIVETWGIKSGRSYQELTTLLTTLTELSLLD